MNKFFSLQDVRLSLPIGSVFHLRFGLRSGTELVNIIVGEGFTYDLCYDDLAGSMESSDKAAKIHDTRAFVTHISSRAPSSSVRLSVETRRDDSAWTGSNITDHRRNIIIGKRSLPTTFLKKT